MSTISEPACYVLVRKAGKLLFVLREHTGYMNGFYSLPAGRVEAGETYLQGALREAKEEVGLVLNAAKLRHVFTQHRWTAGTEAQARTDVFFEAIDWAGEPVNNEPTVHSEIAWLPAADLPANIMDHQLHALQRIAAGETYGEFGFQH